METDLYYDVQPALKLVFLCFRGVKRDIAGECSQNPDMLNRLNDIEKMEPTEKGHVLFAPDDLIQKIKLKNIALIIIAYLCIKYL